MWEVSPVLLDIGCMNIPIEGLVAKFLDFVYHERHEFQVFLFQVVKPSEKFSCAV